MRIRAVGLVAVVALVVASCGGGTPDAAEGVGVHGAWTIDVLNADGSLDERVQFHNEFVGQEVLADLLSMADTMTGWSLTAGPNICSTANGNCFFSATAQRDPATNELVVDGSFSPEFDGEVVRVIANVVTTSTGSKSFSNKALDSPIAIAAGQTVQVEVRYSFGTLP